MPLRNSPEAEARALELRCNGCLQHPDQIEEYVAYGEEEGMTPTEFVQECEGTYNPENGHFLCTSCYIASGMPSSPNGWKAP